METSVKAADASIFRPKAKAPRDDGAAAAAPSVHKKPKSAAAGPFVILAPGAGGAVAKDMAAFVKDTLEPAGFTVRILACHWNKMKVYL